MFYHGTVFVENGQTTIVIESWKATCLKFTAPDPKLGYMRLLF